MLEQLRNQVCQANLMLPAYGLITFTWGNVSGIDRTRSLIVIKPSGIEYSQLTPESMVVVDLDGNVVEGNLRPSSDTPTHLELYRHFPSVGGIVHTHSKWATIFSQAGQSIPLLGTTHADYFRDIIPCTRSLAPAEICGEYEMETGKVIAETFSCRNPMETPAVLVYGHGPFAWGHSPDEAVYHAVVLEQVAMMAWHSMMLGKKESVSSELSEKHFLRKHGAAAYYGQTHN